MRASVTNIVEIGQEIAVYTAYRVLWANVAGVLMRFIARIAAALVVTAVLYYPAEAGSRRIRIALQLPKSSHLYENLDFFKDVVEKGTNGALEIVIAHSGQLIKEQDVPEAVATGAVEMASVAVNQYGSVIPAADLFVQPFMFAYPPALAAAIQPGSPVRAPIDLAILEKVAARVLWWQSSGTTIMLSKGEPLTTPAAIAGRNVRVSTESEAEFVRLCGGIPHIIAAAAHYDALRLGHVIAGSGAIAAVPVRKYWEVAPFVTYTRHRTAEFVVTMNERLWRSLETEHQRIVERAAREAEIRLRARMAAVEQEAHELAEKNGMRLVELTKTGDLDQWKSCAAPMLEAYLNRSGELGAKVMAGYRKIIVEAYRAAPPQLTR
jgi:C4-dicarboxylate-binding protein DctP